MKRITDATTRDLLDELKNGSPTWGHDTTIAELGLRVMQLERDEKEWREFYHHEANRAGRMYRQLVEIAPANSRRKTVATADVQAVWQNHQ